MSLPAEKAEKSHPKSSPAFLLEARPGVLVGGPSLIGPEEVEGEPRHSCQLWLGF